jgi:hypothetical protein
MSFPINIPALCASFTDADLNAIEADLAHQAVTYQYAGPGFEQRKAAIEDLLSHIRSRRKNRRPFCLIPSTLFFN